MGLVTGVLSLAREPVRLTLRVWELGLSSAAEAARHGLELLDPDRGAATVEPYPPPPARPRGNGRAPDLADVAPPDVPPAVPDELIPDHVDEEVVLVAEVAEEGAEDGVGPELHIAEPWEGYDRMAAVEICDRLTAATRNWRPPWSSTSQRAEDGARCSTPPGAPSRASRRTLGA